MGFRSNSTDSEIISSRKPPRISVFHRRLLAVSSRYICCCHALKCEQDVRSWAGNFGGWWSVQTFEGGSGCAPVGGSFLGLAYDVPGSRLDALRHGVALNRSIMRERFVLFCPAEEH